MGHAPIIVNPWMLIPFGVLLALIAMAPVAFPHWWHKHYPKAALALGAIALAYYFMGLREYQRVLHTGIEYVSFIALVGSLFVVSGGIHIQVKGEATPWINTLFLFLGGVLANFLGTTGASMLLIRPWFRMNKYRVTSLHVVFFIFIVSNIGGGLTPIGDPPLFLGYLKGIPFWWVLFHCWKPWLVAMGFMLILFLVLDYRNYLRAPRDVRIGQTHEEHWKFDGLANLFFLAVIIGSVFINKPLFLREALMLAAAVSSYFLTKKEVHRANDFNFEPIKEVAFLFLGIFATMMPALDWLSANAARFANPNFMTFYWGCGVLSSLLDNAPTYLSFLSTLLGSSLVPEGQTEITSLLRNPAIAELVVAISVSAVFFGACTYIGNGPNFMVKAIAEQNKVHAPPFMEYIVRYTVPCMLPMLLLVWLIFFR